MIYDEEIFKKEVLNKDNMEFLINFGYLFEVKIEDYINILKFRYEKYYCLYELGLFFGIFFEDVKDFMECIIKKCLLCGYWKVYNNSG